MTKFKTKYLVANCHNYVTASSGTAISTDFAVLTCSEILSKNRSNLTWHSKHAQDEVPAKKAPQKSRNRRPRQTRTGDD